MFFTSCVFWFVGTYDKQNLLETITQHVGTYDKQDLSETITQHVGTYDKQDLSEMITQHAGTYDKQDLSETIPQHGHGDQQQSPADPTSGVVAVCAVSIVGLADDWGVRL